MATDKKISELPVATAPTGTELMEVVQGGVNKQLTAQDIADLGGGGNFVPLTLTADTTIDGQGNELILQGGAGEAVQFALDGVNNTQHALIYKTGGVVRWQIHTDNNETGSSNVGSDLHIERFDDAGVYIDNPIIIDRTDGVVDFNLPPQLTTAPAASADNSQVPTTAWVQDELGKTRTVTGADSIVQGDDNSLIILNSATPFNFTLDQITASSKASFVNIGAGAVTLVAGSGVTITGSVVIPGAVGTEYPTAFVFYHTATTPRVLIGGTESGRIAVAISTGTLTLDINNEIRRDFDLTATESADFTIAFSNTTNWKESSLTFRLTGTILITMPSTVRMENFENTVGRWNTSTRVLTLNGVTASPFKLLFSPQGSIIECQASDRFV